MAWSTVTWSASEAISRVKLQQQAANQAILLTDKLRVGPRITSTNYTQTGGGTFSNTSIDSVAMQMGIDVVGPLSGTWPKSDSVSFHTGNGGFSARPHVIASLAGAGTSASWAPTLNRVLFVTPTDISSSSFSYEMDSNGGGWLMDSTEYAYIHWIAIGAESSPEANYSLPSWSTRDEATSTKFDQMADDDTRLWDEKLHALHRNKDGTQESDIQYQEIKWGAVEWYHDTGSASAQLTIPFDTTRPFVDTPQVFCGYYQSYATAQGGTNPPSGTGSRSYALKAFVQQISTTQVEINHLYPIPDLDNQAIPQDYHWTIWAAIGEVAPFTG